MTTQEIMRLMSDPDGVRREAFAAVPDLELPDGHRGTLKCGRFAAEIRVEGSDWVRARLCLDGAPPPEAALAGNADLPGNARFSLVRASFHLVAETRIDGVHHLPASLDEIRSAFQRAGGPPHGTAPAPEPLAVDRVERALDRLPSDADGIVRTGEGWEIRPCVGGVHQPVQVAIDGADLRIRRSLPWAHPAGASGAAIACEALRINDEIRFARISLAGESLVVETRLRGGLVDPSWIAIGARAVGAAFQHCLPPLAALRDDPRAAAIYVRFQR